MHTWYNSLIDELCYWSSNHQLDFQCCKKRKENGELKNSLCRVEMKLIDSIIYYYYFD